MANGRTVLSVGVLVGVLGLAIGASVGFVLAPEPIPAVLGVSDGSKIVDVVPRQFDDKRTVSVSPSLTKSREFSSQASGVLRTTKCKAGKTIKSGSSPFSVDDHPVLALHLAAPPFRDLNVGDKGADVVDLQKEFVRLGHKMPIDGKYSYAMGREVAALWKSVGLPETEKLTSVPLDRLIWLKTKSVKVASCKVKVGDRLEPGGIVFSAGGKLDSLTLTLPESAQVGARVAVLELETETLKAAVAESGVVDDPEFLASFAKTRGFKEWLTSKDDSKLSITTVLVDEISVVPVPPAALFGVLKDQGCVISYGEALKVRIVASELGETYVTASKLPSQISLDIPSGVTSCE